MDERIRLEGSPCRCCGKPRTIANCTLHVHGNKVRFYFLCKDCKRAKERLTRRPGHSGSRILSYPHKKAARTKVANALKSGKLIKQPCEVCGEKADAHHDDYDKPLEVRWLCRLHHAMEHWKPTDSPLMETVIRSRVAQEKKA